MINSSRQLHTIDSSSYCIGGTRCHDGERRHTEGNQRKYHDLSDHDFHEFRDPFNEEPEHNPFLRTQSLFRRSGNITEMPQKNVKNVPRPQQTNLFDSFGQHVETTNRESVTQFYVNLNLQEPEKPKKKQNTVTLQDIVERLHKSLKGASDEARRVVNSQVSDRFITQLRRLAIKLEMSNSDKENRKSSRSHIIKQRECIDKEKGKIHIEMIKVVPQRPREQSSWRKPKQNTYRR